MPPLSAAGSERIEMSRKYVRVAVDAMGGDLAPAEPVKAAVEALEKTKSLHVTLVGQEEVIRAELAKYKYPEDRLEILDAREIIEMSEPPVNAIRKKKDSSIVRGLKLVKEGTCDAFVTAGSTGATLAGGQLLVGRIRGIERPPLAPLMPTAKGPVLLVDCGANMDARPSQLVQFAQMGSIYMKNMTGVENPRVALVNVGAEEEKGNALVKEVYPLLKECEGINFIGNIEARDIPAGEADVVVCDAFVGNVILKLYEGLASTLIHKIKDALMSTLRSKLGALMIKPALKGMLKEFDITSYGGAPMLGLRGLVVKTHGNSEAVEIRNAIEQCILFKKKDINGQFIEKMGLEQPKKADEKETASSEKDASGNTAASEN
jgi:glycerol-3-phosphate acyltransferase PlsX